MSNKQTSVDWQFDQLSSENLLGLFTYDQMKRAMEILERAKAMHKEEIIHVHGEEQSKLQDDGSWKIQTSEQYYNETYGGNK